MKQAHLLNNMIMNDLPEGSTIGAYPYKIIRKLGTRQGAMSVIYLASVGDLGQNKPLVVLKIARVDNEQREFYRQTLENEVERLRRLKHPGIVRIFPIERHGIRNLPYMAQAELPGRPWFSVMEYLSGGSLADLLKREKSLDIGLALEIGRSIANTLDYLHNLQQVHLDIKPANVLFRYPLQDHAVPEPVLVDFGICRNIGQGGLEAGTLQWSSPERILAARGHVPPEQIRPHPSMDIYALGLLIYQMVTGRLPYEGRTRESLTTAILAGKATAPSQYQPLVKPELDELILQMIARDPAKRPQADEVARILEELAIRLGYQSHYGYTYIKSAHDYKEVTKESKSKLRRLYFITTIIVTILVIENSWLLSIKLIQDKTYNPTQVNESQPLIETITPESPVPTSSPTNNPLVTLPTPTMPAVNSPKPVISPTPSSALEPTATPVSTHTPTPTRNPTSTPTPTPSS
jgi:serine/threonine protein kinase